MRRPESQQRGRSIAAAASRLAMSLSRLAMATAQVLRSREQPGARLREETRTPALATVEATIGINTRSLHAHTSASHTPIHGPSVHLPGDLVGTDGPHRVLSRPSQL